MDIFDHNLEPVRALWQVSPSRQSLQMIIYKAIASTTDVSGKNIEMVLKEIDNLLEVEVAQAPRRDSAM